MSTNTAPNFDYAIVGGGLQGCLVAIALAHHRPEARVLLVERASKLCGNHTWSFHQTDVPPEACDWFDPLVAYRWSGYFVRFPALTRRVNIPYATITSDRLREATMALAAGADGPDRPPSLVVRTGESCTILGPNCLKLTDGPAVSCQAVLDCRGRSSTTALSGGVGYQTFIGHEYATDGRWPRSEPTVMDVREDQAGGFEFLYELPFGSHRVLLEYTRFHEEPTADEARASRLIAKRLREAGGGPAELVRTERGCLPMPYASHARRDVTAVAGGYAGDWYHAATGYSMPLALRFAELVARASPERVAEAVAEAAAKDRLRRGFARFLNRLLFCLVRPADRWKIFQRFYRVLPEERISRFYAHRFTATDAARIVIGRPPAGLAPIRFARSFAPLPRPVPT